MKLTKLPLHSSSRYFYRGIKFVTLIFVFFYGYAELQPLIFFGSQEGVFLYIKEKVNKKLTANNKTHEFTRINSLSSIIASKSFIELFIEPGLPITLITIT